MSAHPGLGKGLDPKLMLTGLGVSAVGLFFSYVGFFTDRGVRLGPIPIPLSIVGPLLVLGGIGIAAFSFRQLKCLLCKQALESSMAFFPLPSEGVVVAAVQRGDAQLLAREPMGSPADPHVQVSLSYCDTCKAIGEVDVDAFRPDRATVVPRTTISGPAVGHLAALVKAREEAHEQRHENA